MMSEEKRTSTYLLRQLHLATNSKLIVEQFYMRLRDFEIPSGIVRRSYTCLLRVRLSSTLSSFFRFSTDRHLSPFLV